MANEIMEMTGVNANALSNSLSTASSAVFWVSFIAFLGMIVLYFMWFTSFNKNLILKRTINGSSRRENRKAKFLIKKDGESYLQIRNPNPFKKDLHPMPIQSVIEVGARGKEFISARQLPTGELIYLRDNGFIPEIPKDLLDSKNYSKEFAEELALETDENLKEFKVKRYNQKIMDNWKKTNNVTDAYQPISSNQRSFYLSQIRKANDKKPESLMDRISKLALPMMLVVMLAVMLIFGGKLYEPAVRLSENVVQHDKLIISLADKLDAMDKHIQGIDTSNETLKQAPT
jgi:hypothetical protein